MSFLFLLALGQEIRLLTTGARNFQEATARHFEEVGGWKGALFNEDDPKGGITSKCHTQAGGSWI